ncbi:50S ribosomal protein L28 [Streptococcus equi subsp. zooepidemicus]|nr:L28 family ribosomal protein [Streptococcus equi]MCD3454469.1 50S ribosomal protein L28 [Streptococcus equi subsp. zooepidemicus]
MAKVCYFTGRKTVSGNNRSHAMNPLKINQIFINGEGMVFIKKVWALFRSLEGRRVFCQVTALSAILLRQGSW